MTDPAGSTSGRSAPRYRRPAALLLALAAAGAAYFLVAGRKPSQREKLRRDFRSGDYAACIRRIIEHPDAFHTDFTRRAADDLRRLSGNTSFPVVPPSPEFFRRRAFYGCIAARLARPARRETVLAAFEFVVREVPPVAGPGEQPDIGVMPHTILLRGYGACDRSAWVLCTLLESLGIGAYVVYLRDPQTGASHHTIAAAEIDNNLFLLDTWAGLPVLTRAGRCATFREVAADPAVIDDILIGGRRQFATGTHVANALVLLPFEAETVHPISAAVQETLAAETPPLYHNFRRRLMHLGALLFAGGRVDDRTWKLTAEDCRYEAALWDYPFRTGHNSRIPQYARSVAAAHPWLQALRHARWEYLAGGHREDAYDDVIASLPADDPARIAAEYFRGACLLSRNAEGAVDAAEAFLEQHPGSAWAEPMLMLLGEALAARGEPTRAATCLAQVTGPRALRAAWLLERIANGEELRPSPGDMFPGSPQ